MKLSNFITSHFAIIGKTLALSAVFCGGNDCDTSIASAACVDLRSDTCCVPGGNWASAYLTFVDPEGLEGTTYTGFPACANVICRNPNDQCILLPYFLTTFLVIYFTLLGIFLILLYCIFYADHVA
jgi:hypothetical protein